MIRMPITQLFTQYLYSCVGKQADQVRTGFAGEGVSVPKLATQLLQHALGYHGAAVAAAIACDTGQGTAVGLSDRPSDQTRVYLCAGDYGCA